MHAQDLGDVLQLMAVAEAADVPAAPAFATMYADMRDVSVPMIIDDLLDTAARPPWMRRCASGCRWATPNRTREGAARFLWATGKPTGQTQFATAAAIPSFSTPMPSARTAPHAGPFQSTPATWRRCTRMGITSTLSAARLAPLGGAGIAEEAPCKEWWSLRARPGPLCADARDARRLVAVARRLPDVTFDANARAMAAARALGLRSFAPDGLVAYVETLGALTRLQRNGGGGGGGGGGGSGFGGGAAAGRRQRRRHRGHRVGPRR